MCGCFDVGGESGYLCFRSTTTTGTATATTTATTISTTTSTGATTSTTTSTSTTTTTMTTMTRTVEIPFSTMGNLHSTLLAMMGNCEGGNRGCLRTTGHVTTGYAIPIRLEQNTRTCSSTLRRAAGRVYSSVPGRT